jgi:hypothetical protein
MVKTRALFLAASVILASGCSVFVRSEKANPDVLQIARGRLGSEVSLARAAGSLVAVYSDWETTGLYEAEVPIADHLPAAPAPARLIDRIDAGPPLASSFGQHTLVSSGNTVTVFYLARAAEDKMILKLASHAMGTEDWTIDAVEPPGTPLAMLPAAPGRLDLFWSAGSLLTKTYPGTGPADTLVSPFVPDGRAGTFDPVSAGDRSAGPGSYLRGLTAFDSASGQLFLMRWNGSTYDTVKIDGAGPASSSLAVAGGRVAVLFWTPSTRRIELLTLGQEDSSPSRTTVTVSAGTKGVQLLPPADREQSRMGATEEPRADTLLFLYDDTRRLGGGRSQYELSLLAPAKWGLGHKYRRVVLLSGTDPIESFSALEVGETLYVLVRQDGVKLLELKLP